jgi:hypothetical protein
MVRPASGRIAILVIGLRDVHFTADNGLNSRACCRVIEPDGSEQIAMIGNGHRGHAIAGRGLRKHVVVDSAVEQTESRMQVKMDELRQRYSHSIVAGGFDVMS